MIKLKDICFKKATEGDVGIEIEVEAEDEMPFVDGWMVEHEGSLRNNGREYVTPGPISICDLRPVLETFESALAPSFPIEDSPRTSVHVHVNHQESTPMQIWNTAVAFWLLENPLVRWCGEHRVNNLFCLRLIDAENILDICNRSVKGEEPFGGLHQDYLKYASQNFGNILGLNTLEYRSLRGTTCANTIFEWAECLVHIRDVARTFASPEHIMDTFYREDIETFASRFLTPEMLTNIKQQPDWKVQINENVGSLCNFVYTNDWSKWEEAIEENYETYTPAPRPQVQGLEDFGGQA